MSNLETLKAQHPEWKWDDLSARVRPGSEAAPWLCDELARRDEQRRAMESIIQQHEATIAELEAKREAYVWLALGRNGKIYRLRSDLAAAQDTIQQQARELEEADRALIGTFHGPNGHGYYDATGPYGFKRNEAVYREALRREAERPIEHAVGCGFKGTVHVGQCTCGALARHYARAQQAEAKKGGA